MPETRISEGNAYVTNGSRHCPSPEACDQRPGETYEGYVRRHCIDHGLGEFEFLADAERNLGVWCLFYLDKHVIENLSIGTKSSAGEFPIVAEYEPCWEDAEFLANWDFHPDDLEQFTPWNERRFTLLPFEKRRAGEVKRFKKETKVRGTQKTSRAKALVTFEHLHQYHVLGNIFFRVLTISAVSRTARDHYFKPLRQLWRSNKNIKRLYGAWETRCSCIRGAIYISKAGDHCPSCGEAIDPKAKTRRVGLIGFGSAGIDTLTVRWNVSSEDSSGMAIVSLMCAGVETQITGSRWDLVVFDDPHNRQNTQTHERRQKVKDTHAELRKQLDARGRLLWLNTPWHPEDASAEIDDPDCEVCLTLGECEKHRASEFHILYRPGEWLTPEGRWVEYWSMDALGRPVWPRGRLDAEKKSADYGSQIRLRARSKEDQLCQESDFLMVDPDRAPLEVRVGRGVAIAEEDSKLLNAEGVSVRGIVYVDPAGLEKRRKYGADTGIVGVRFSRHGDVYIVHIDSGRWGAVEENEAMYQAWIHTHADLIRCELSGAHQKHVKASSLAFQAQKSAELNRAVIMPFSWDPVSTGRSKDERVEAAIPLVRCGRVKILTDAGTPEQIAKFKRQMAYYGTEPLKDLADAFSGITADADIPSWEEIETAKKVAAARAEFVPNEDGVGGTFIVDSDFISDLVRAQEEEFGEGTPWGLAGRPEVTIEEVA